MEGNGFAPNLVQLFVTKDDFCDENGGGEGSEFGYLSHGPLWCGRLTWGKRNVAVGCQSMVGGRANWRSGKECRLHG